VKAPLNLARHPFRNERLPTLLLGVGTLALLVATARHASVAWELLPGRARDVSLELASLEADAQRVRAEAASLRKLAASSDTIAEWAAVKALVDRRAFAWTGLLAALEEALPPGVRLVSIQPAGAGSGAELTLAAQGRSSQDALALLQSLQAHADFQGAFLNSWTDGREGVDISCSVNYVPRAGAKQ